LHTVAVLQVPEDVNIGYFALGVTVSIYYREEVVNQYRVPTALPPIIQ
jgi:hypothetical protein